MVTESLRTPLCDKRKYRCLRTSSGVRAVVVQDPEATFAACCANVQAGYFDDPEDLPGLAHFLEHAVHLGSEKYPEENSYKMYLSQHGGSSNASTSMVHTQFHFSCHSSHIEGAVDRLAQFFCAPLLLPGAIEREVNAVHAEYSRNTNSDQRKLLQLRRSTGNRPYSGFSTGSIETLWEGPKLQGVDVPGALRSLWKRRYLASATTVVLVAPQDLDELELMVRESWKGANTGGDLSSATPGFHPGRNEPCELPLGSRYSLDGDVSRELGMLFQVAPKRDLRKLELVWFVPWGLHHDWESKPSRWVAHMLGTEVEGSVAFVLKRKGWLQELYTDTGDEVRLGRGFAFFKCTMELTEEGEEHVAEIASSVYQGIQLLRTCPLRERSRFFYELQELANLGFDWKSREQPREYSKKLAQRLHYFEPEQLLHGAEVPKVEDWAAVDRLLASLTTEAMNIYHVSPRFRGLPNIEKEKWYGAQYTRSPIPRAILDPIQAVLECRSADGAAALSLPGPNWALHVDVSMRPEEPSPAGELPESLREHLESLQAADGIQAPVCLRDDSHLRLWHCQDTSFGIPKALLYMHVMNPCVYENPRAFAMTRLLLMALERHLEPRMYHANLAKCYSSIDWGHTGLTLSFTGFSDVLPRMVAMVASTLKEMAEAQVLEHLPTVKGELKQSLWNWRHNNPASHVGYAARHLLVVPHWHTEAVLPEVDGISARDLIRHLKAVTGQSYVEVLGYGNLHAHETRALAEQILSAVSRHPLHSCQMPRRRVLCLSPTALPCLGPCPKSGSGAVRVSYSPRNPNPENNDSAVHVMFQIGRTSQAEAALVYLFAQMASRPCFYQLRTVEQLGYSVSSGCSNMEGVLSFRVTIQSPKKGPQALVERVLLWLKGFREQLVQMSHEEFSNNTSSLAATYREPPKTLGEAAGRIWGEVADRSYCFSWRSQRAAAVQGATMDQVLHLFDTRLSPDGPGTYLLDVRISGGALQEEVASTSESHTVLADDDAGTTRAFQISRPMMAAHDERLHRSSM